MRIFKILVMLMVAVVMLVILAGQIGLLRGPLPDGLGVHGGRLKPPSLTPNSVSSQANLDPGHPRHIDAMIDAFPAGVDGYKSLNKIATILGRLGHTQIVKKEGVYLYAQCTTPLMGFTDDLEFWLDVQQGVIHVRSASRLGANDLGANRKRVETIRAQFLQN